MTPTMAKRFFNGKIGDIYPPREVMFLDITPCFFNCFGFGCHCCFDLFYIRRLCHTVLFSLTFHFLLLKSSRFVYLIFLNLTIKFNTCQNILIASFFLVINDTSMSTFKCTHHQLRSLMLARIFTFTVQPLKYHNPGAAPTCICRVPAK